MELLVEDADFVTMAARAPDRPLPAGPGRPDRGRRPGRAGPRRGRAGRPGGAAGRGDRHPRADRRALPRVRCRLPGGGGRLPPAVRAGHPGDPGPAAGRGRPHPAGSWVTGSGYVEYQLREGRHPTRADLDAAVPDRPAVLYHTSLHACVLNSAALPEAGFADGQPDPPGGAFGRDARAGSTACCTRARCSRCSSATSGTTWPGWAPPSGPGWWSWRASIFAALGVTSACDADVRRDTLHRVRRGRRARPAASGSTGWSCTTRWTGCSTLACAAATPPG